MVRYMLYRGGLSQVHTWQQGELSAADYSAITCCSMSDYSDYINSMYNTCKIHKQLADCTIPWLINDYDELKF